MRQKFFGVPFGFSGDLTEIPNAQQPDGSVSFTKGWDYDYQRDQETDSQAKPIDRMTMNWLFKAITEALRQYQAEAVPEYITPEDNGGTEMPVPFAYEKGVWVRWRAADTDPFVVYVSLVNNNTSEPSDTTKWQTLEAYILSHGTPSGGTVNQFLAKKSNTNGDTEWKNIPDQVNSDWNATSGKAQILNKPDLSAYLPVTGGTVSGNITTSSFGTRYGIGEFQCLTFLNNESDQDFEHVPVLYAGYDANNHARYALTRRGEIVSEVTFNGQYLGRRRIPSIVEKGGTVNWYRKWSDGWLEQGGYFSSSDVLQSIVFPLPYKNGDYTLTIGTIRSAVNTPNVVIQDKLQSYFNVLSTDGTNGNWHTCGWGV